MTPIRIDKDKFVTEICFFVCLLLSFSVSSVSGIDDLFTFVVCLLFAIVFALLAGVMIFMEHILRFTELTQIYKHTIMKLKYPNYKRKLEFI